jgi:hypothetical protein
MTIGWLSMEHCLRGVLSYLHSAQHQFSYPFPFRSFLGGVARLQRVAGVYEISGRHTEGMRLIEKMIKVVIDDGWMDDMYINVLSWGGERAV